MIAISTAWNAKRHDSAKAVFDELRSLGYRRFEVNVHFSEPMVAETEALVKAGEVEIVSVHNYCPVPEGVERLRGGGDLFPLSHESLEVRSLAALWGKRTIETAARLGAKMVVGHWGQVELPSAKQIQKEAIDLLREDDRTGLAVLYDLVDARNHLRAHPLERALETFAQLIPHAREHGVRLGVENRNYFHEIPSLDEVGMFIDQDPDVVGYWHDMGHAEILEYLEIYPPNAYRDRWADSAMAVHVHDVREGADHLAMGAGSIDFMSKLSAFANAQWIVETHHADAEAIRRMGEELSLMEAEIRRG